MLAFQLKYTTILFIKFMNQVRLSALNLFGGPGFHSNQLVGQSNIKEVSIFFLLAKKSFSLWLSVKNCCAVFSEATVIWHLSSGNGCPLGKEHCNAAWPHEP